MLNNDDKQIISVIEKSDDFDKYGNIFMDISKKLVQEKKCTVEDFRNYGGWCKSQNFKNQNVYFLYCGNANHVRERLYLDVDKKEVFQ